MRSLLTWDDGGTQVSVVCDAIIGLTDERTSSVTRHPIENGSTVSDHVVLNPDRLVVELRQTNEPIGSTDGFKNIVLDGYSRKQAPLEIQPNAFKPQGLFLLHSAAGNLVKSIVGKKKGQKVYVLQADTEKDRIVELHDQLINAHIKKVACSLDLHGRSYINYVINSVVYERRGGGLGGLGQFRLGLEAVRFVSTATTELPDAAAFHAKPTTSRGTKPGKDTTKPDDITKPDSIFKQGLGAAYDNLFSGL